MEKYILHSIDIVAFNTIIIKSSNNFLNKKTVKSALDFQVCFIL